MPDTPPSDDTLREAIADIFDKLLIPNEYWHRQSSLHYADKILALITTTQAKAVAEADRLARIDELELAKASSNRGSHGISKNYINSRLKALKGPRASEAIGHSIDSYESHSRYVDLQQSQQEEQSE